MENQNPIFNCNTFERKLLSDFVAISFMLTGVFLFSQYTSFELTGEARDAFLIRRQRWMHERAIELANYRQTLRDDYERRLRNETIRIENEIAKSCDDTWMRDIKNNQALQLTPILIGDLVHRVRSFL